MRESREDAGTVARIFLAAAGPAMVHVFEHQDGITDDVMRLAAFDVGDKSYTATIVFQLGLIETVARGQTGVAMRANCIQLRVTSTCEVDGVGNIRSIVARGRRAP